jgi:dipeptidase
MNRLGCCLATLLLLGVTRLAACTNILVTKGASRDGSTMIAYSADALGFYGSLAFKAGGPHAPGETREIVDWETGRPLGRIPEAPATYTRVGNINACQLVIGESTFGGREELEDPRGGIDYGSLIHIALERTRTAREAIRLMAGLVDQYGYASTGESFSIADPEEVWMMELIGKGPGRKGAVWVAVRIPDGTIAAHANQARIRKFPQDDPANCLFSPDVIAFAREQGYFTGPDRDFSFARAYAPLSFAALRDCESRVWSIFNRAARKAGIPSDFARAVPGSSPMPLSVRPDHPLSAQDVMQLMRDHYEGTAFDMTRGAAADPFGSPYRCRPLTLEVQGRRYVQDRPISTCTTGWSFVSQSRASLPDPVGGLLWFGVDDTYTTCYFPVYCGVTEVPANWGEAGGGDREFSWNSAFWVANAVSNWTYARWDAMFPEVQKVQRELEEGFFRDQDGVEAEARKRFAASPDQARAFLTDYTSRQGGLVFERYKALFGYLMWKYCDFGTRDSRGRARYLPYPEAFRRRIVEEQGPALEAKPLDPSLDQ